MIPQCEYRTTRTEFLEWYFYRSKAGNPKTISSSTEKNKIIALEISEVEINELIEEEKKHIARLPKRDPSDFTPQIDEIRNYYPRAYEYF